MNYPRTTLFFTHIFHIFRSPKYPHLSSEHFYEHNDEDKNASNSIYDLSSNLAAVQAAATNSNPPPPPPVHPLTHHRLTIDEMNGKQQQQQHHHDEKQQLLQQNENSAQKKSHLKSPFSSNLVTVMMDDKSRDDTADEHSFYLTQQHLHHLQQQQQQLRREAENGHHHLQHHHLKTMDMFDEGNNPIFVVCCCTIHRHNETSLSLSCHVDLPNQKVVPKVERADTPINDLVDEEDEATFANCSPAEHLQSIFLTEEERKQWNDVVRMSDYLTKGRRPQFWEEPFTKRVLDAIKNKNLEMKKAAKLLGVSYGTLYGRYRETYGCLKHPYRYVREIFLVWYYVALTNDLFAHTGAHLEPTRWCQGCANSGQETATMAVTF